MRVAVDEDKEDDDVDVVLLTAINTVVEMVILRTRFKVWSCLRIARSILTFSAPWHEG